MQNGYLFWTLNIDSQGCLTMRTASPGVFTEFSRVPDRWENDLPCETTPKKAERGLPPPHSTLIQPILSPSCPGERAPWEGQSPCLWAKAEGCVPYQVWRGGLGLRSVIIHVQIDQDFSGSPYPTGYFPYCQLPKSRGRGDRDKDKTS